MNKRLQELLVDSGSADFTDAEKRAVKRAANFFGQLEDHVLVEVTRFAVSTCAFRLAVDPNNLEAGPTPEVFKHALRDTIKLIEKSVNDDF